MNCEFSINLSSLIVSVISLVVSIISLLIVLNRLPKNKRSITGDEVKLQYDKIKDELTDDRLSVSEICKVNKNKIFPNLIIENCNDNSISDIKFLGSKKKVTYYIEENGDRWRKIWYLR